MGGLGVGRLLDLYFFLFSADCILNRYKYGPTSLHHFHVFLTGCRLLCIKTNEEMREDNAAF